MLPFMEYTPPNYVEPAVARFLDVDIDTLAEWRSRGVGPRTRPPHQFAPDPKVYPPEEVETWWALMTQRSPCWGITGPAGTRTQLVYGTLAGGVQ